MKQNQAIPELRFPEFQSEWSKKPLSKWVETNPKTKNLPKTFTYIDLESVSNGTLLFEKEVNACNAPSRAQRVLSKNDVLFQMVRPYQQNNYFFCKEGKYVASTGYAQLRAKDQNDPKFIYYAIHTTDFSNDVMDRCTGTSYPAINSNDLEKILVSFPQQQEQQKIAEFLSAVDKKISQLQKKKDLLEDYKKGCMQKLFSQEIRFTDDNGNSFPDWEEKELGELLDYQQPTKYLVSSTEYSDKYKTPVLTAGKTFILGYTNEVEGVFSKHLPTIIFDDFTTAFHYVNFPFKAKSSAMKMLIVKNKEDNIEYIHAAMTQIDFAIGEHKRYWISEYQKELISYPHPDEQRKIANFLSSIDKKISLVSDELNKAKDFKQGLLQQMFV